VCGSRRQPSYEHDSFWLMQLPAMLVVEIDRGQHVDARRYDAERTRVLEARGYRVLRFWNDEVLHGRCAGICLAEFDGRQRT
jgi:very-short-patch-repair endonuclease